MFVGVCVRVCVSVYLYFVFVSVSVCKFVNAVFVHVVSACCVLPVHESCFCVCARICLL